MGVMRPELIMKSVLPAVMAGIIGIYGLVIGVLITNQLDQIYSLFNGCVQLAAGLAVGLSGLSAGFAVGYVFLLDIYSESLVTLVLEEVHINQDYLLV
jgi:V-type H+-transporting ATPase proteolipid subunit